MSVIYYYHEEDEMYEIVDGFYRYKIMLKYLYTYKRENRCLSVSVL